MTCYWMHSAQSGAPALSGTAGSLVALLDAVLVDGFGTVGVSSITRSGSTVTVTTTGSHGFERHATVQISGAAQAEYNGKWRVLTAPTATTFTFDIGGATPASPATGTITLKRAPVGWSKPFSGTNKAVYRLPSGSSQRYLRVLDDGTMSGNGARTADVRVYETMSDVDTGTNPTPIAAQTSRWIKSDTLNSTARGWAVIADDQFVHLFTSANSDTQDWQCFGDLVPVFDFPLTPSFLGTSDATVTSPSSDSAMLSSNQAPAAGVMLRVVPDDAGMLPAVNAALICLSMSTSNQTMQALYASADGAGAGFFDFPVYVRTSSRLAGVLPGVNLPVNAQDESLGGTVYEDIVGRSGRAILAQRVGYTSNTDRCAHFDITGPWR